MKKQIKGWIFAILAALVLAGCAQTVTEKIVKEKPVSEGYAIQTADGVRYVKNSDWDPVTLSTLTAKVSARSVYRASAAITAEELADIVEELNDETNDGQYFVDDEDVPAEEGPLCDVYIVNEIGPEGGTDDDYAVLREFHDVERAYVKDRRHDWALEAMGVGGILFVDKVPELPSPVIDPRTDEEKYIIYVLYEDTGEIFITYNCVERTSAPDFFITSGYKDIKEYYDMNLYGIRREHDHILGKIVITGYFYTPPSLRPPVVE